MTDPIPLSVVQADDSDGVKEAIGRLIMAQNAGTIRHLLAIAVMKDGITWTLMTGCRTAEPHEITGLLEMTKYNYIAGRTVTK